MFLRVLRRVLRIALPEKFIHIVGDIHCPLGPVSYTHLDVYKRQDLNDTEIGIIIATVQALLDARKKGE